MQRRWARAAAGGSSGGGSCGRRNMDYAKNLDPKTFNNTHDYILELVRRGLQAGYDLEDVTEHYKELIQNEATAIMKSTERNELQKQIQKDLDNLAVIDRNNTIVFPLELAGRTYKADERDKYLEEILQKRLERRHKVNKLRESVLQHNLDDITEHVKTILDHDKKEEEAFTSQFK